MKLSEVERSYIITLNDGRVGYAGEKVYKADTRPVHFRVDGKTVTEEIAEGTEVVISLVPEKLIWDYLDQQNVAESELEFEKSKDEILKWGENQRQRFEQTKAELDTARKLEIEQHEYARKAEQIELNTALKSQAEDLETELKRIMDNSKSDMSAEKKEEEFILNRKLNPGWKVGDIGHAYEPSGNYIGEYLIEKVLMEGKAFEGRVLGGTIKYYLTSEHLKRLPGKEYI